jgi:hypothetical protein
MASDRRALRTCPSAAGAIRIINFVGITRRNPTCQAIVGKYFLKGEIGAADAPNPASLAAQEEP